MRRREFITLVGSAAVAWPFAVTAQQGARVRRIAVLSTLPADDPIWQIRIAAFHQALGELGWTIGRNIQIEYSVSPGNDAQLRRRAAELVALAPEVILCNGTSAVQPMMDATRSVPIVFINVTDPLGAGYVASLARPGANITGFAQFEYGMSGKWLELLKQIAPSLKRVAVLRDPTTPTGIAQLASITSSAPSFGVVISPLDVRVPADIDRAVTGFAAGGNGGLILSSGAPSIRNRELVVALAARHRLPSIYPYRGFAVSGGLMSYGVDATDAPRGAAGYVDRILKGERPADLPVQQPTKFELVVNLKVAKAIGLTVPQNILASADEVIE